MTLKKTLGLGALTVYGVGNMLGAGVYGLIGKAAGEMGNAVWLSFVASMVAAGLTGLSFASLGSRYPKAAGTSYIAHRAFMLPMLAYIVGLAVMASGLTSMATTTQVFSGYFLQFTQVADTATTRAGIVVAVVLFLALINFWGMSQSSFVNIICTAVEVGGLLLVIFVGARYWGSVDYLDWSSANNPTGEWSTGLLLSGAVLTFYSFIGFEDLLNVSEEVKDPRRTFPIALLLALAITTVIYLGICITVVSVIPHQQLANSSAPLSSVMEVAAPWFNTRLFSAIALFAVLNTALLNYIMGSRLAYGMSQQSLLPAFLGKLHRTRRTPHVAIIILGVLVLLLALSGDIKALAKATSLLLLGSFTIVNASLVVLQRRDEEPSGGFEIPSLVPIAGIVVCLSMLASEVFAARDSQNYTSLVIAGVIIAAICLMYLVLRPKNQVGMP